MSLRHFLVPGETVMSDNSSHYSSLRYLHAGRMVSYWYQMKEIENTGCSTILEVGTGNGFLARELEPLLGVNHVGLDKSIGLKPNVVGQLPNLPWADNAFCAVVACQILEHIPFDQFSHLVAELGRIASRRVIISLPDRYPYYSVKLRIPLIGHIRWGFSLRRSHGLVAENPSHEWEVGLQGYPLSKVHSVISDCGLEIIETYRVPDFPYHRFLILSHKVQGHRKPHA